MNDAIQFSLLLNTENALNGIKDVSKTIDALEKHLNDFSGKDFSFTISTDLGNTIASLDTLNKSLKSVLDNFNRLDGVKTKLNIPIGVDFDEKKVKSIFTSIQKEVKAFGGTIKIPVELDVSNIKKSLDGALKDASASIALQVDYDQKQLWTALSEIESNCNSFFADDKHKIQLQFSAADGFEKVCEEIDELAKTSISTATQQLDALTPYFKDFSNKINEYVSKLRQVKAQSVAIQMKAYTKLTVRKKDLADFVQECKDYFAQNKVILHVTVHEREKALMGMCKKIALQVQDILNDYFKKNPIEVSFSAKMAKITKTESGSTKITSSTSASRSENVSDATLNKTVAKGFNVMESMMCSIIDRLKSVSMKDEKGNPIKGFTVSIANENIRQIFDSLVRSAARNKETGITALRGAAAAITGAEKAEAAQTDEKVANTISNRLTKNDETVFNEAYEQLNKLLAPIDVLIENIKEVCTQMRDIATSVRQTAESFSKLTVPDNLADSLSDAIVKAITASNQTISLALPENFTSDMGKEIARAIEKTNAGLTAKATAEIQNTAFRSVFAETPEFKEVLSQFWKANVASLAMHNIKGMKGKTEEEQEEYFKSLVKNAWVNNEGGVNSDKALTRLFRYTSTKFSNDMATKEMVTKLCEVLEKSSTRAFDTIVKKNEKYVNAETKRSESEKEFYDKRSKLVEKEIEKLDEAKAAREAQNALRVAIYKRNVGTATNMLNEQIALGDQPEKQKLTSQYNRARQRILGIYESAMVHHRVENPQTILAGLTELQQRSYALTNYNLSEQMGINDLQKFIKETLPSLAKTEMIINRIGSTIQNITQAFSAVQQVATNITNTVWQFARGALQAVYSKVSQLVSEATTAFQSLEMSMIGFENFFGEEGAARVYKQIKEEAAKAPGLATTDLAEYVSQIAPLSNGDSNLALNAALGMLKTIQYGGANGSSEMEYVVKNIRDVLAKGTATQIDLNQFNRAMPILTKAFESIGKSSFVSDEGILTINKSNVNDLLAAFAELNTSELSEVATIFDKTNLTLSGQWEQFTEQFTTNLMETLQNSQVYGGLQNLLLQVNAGQYVQTSLLKLTDIIADLINSINWFDVQRIATEIWDSLQIVGDSIVQCFGKIKSALGNISTKDLFDTVATWLAKLIEGFTDGLTMVLNLMKKVESSGLSEALMKTVGWLSSVGGQLVKLIGTLAGNLTTTYGKLKQAYTTFASNKAQEKLNLLQEQLDAMPQSIRSVAVGEAELLFGKGGITDLADVEKIKQTSKMTSEKVKEIAQKLGIKSNEKGSVIGEISTCVKDGIKYAYTTNYGGYSAIGTFDEATQKYNWSGYSDDYAAYQAWEKIAGDKKAKVKTYPSSASPWGELYTAENNGKRYVYSSNYGGGHAIGTYNTKTKSYDFSGFSNEEDARAYWQKVTTQNFLQASNSPLLQKIGNNKTVNSTIKTAKEVGDKIVKLYKEKIAPAISKTMTGLAITESITTLITSLNLFGDASETVASIVQAAGFAITGAIAGATIGGLAGGVVGALIGLGVGIVSLVKTINEQKDELTNKKVQTALSEGQKEIRDTVVDALISVGALSANLSERTDEESYALQQLSNVIANSSSAELEALGAQGLADVYGDALRFKTVTENFTGNNGGQGYYWDEHATGKTVTSDDKEYLSKVYKAVNKYDLLANHGYSQGIVDGERVYVDSSGNAISAETIWNEFFNTQSGLDTVTSGQIDGMLEYLEEQEDALTDDWTKVEDALGQISDTPGMTWYNRIQSTIDKMNASLLALVRENSTDEGISAVVGKNAITNQENVESSKANRSLKNAIPNSLDSRVVATNEDGTQNVIESMRNALKYAAEKYGYDTTAIDAMADEDIKSLYTKYKLNKIGFRSSLTPEKVYKKILDALETETDSAKIDTLYWWLKELSGFEIKEDGSNWFWWLKWLGDAKRATGIEFFAHGGLANSPFSSLGIDTVPAMLSPGEFVVKNSAVKKAGLGALYALNRGDLGLAARSLAGNVSNNWYKNNNASINNSKHSKTVVNHFNIVNKNHSARASSYYALANRMAF